MSVEYAVETDEYVIYPTADNGYTKYQIKHTRCDSYFNGTVADTQIYVDESLAKREKAGANIKTDKYGKLPRNLPAKCSAQSIYSSNRKVLEVYMNENF